MVTMLLAVLLGSVIIVAATNVTAVGTVITAISTAVVATYAILQLKHSKNVLREMSSAKNADVVLRVFEIMDDVRKDRRRIYNLDDNFEKWTSDHKQLAIDFSGKLEQVAYLALNDLVDENHVMEVYARVFYTCWRQLENFIWDYRVTCGDSPVLQKGEHQQRQSLEVFAKKCKQKYGFSS